MNDQMNIFSNVTPTLEARDYKGAIMVTEPIGCDVWNLKVTGGTAVALTDAYGSHGSCPKVLVPIGFDAYNQELTGGVSKTLNSRATDTDHIPCALEPIPLENHPADSRLKISDDGKCQTLSSRMGTGGGNTPMILEPIVLESNQNHATINDKGVCTTLSASMGLGGDMYQW